MPIWGYLEKIVENVFCGELLDLQIFRCEFNKTDFSVYFIRMLR